MKKTLKTLMLIAIIAMGINLTEIKAETMGEITIPETTVQEATTIPETTTPQEATTIPETTMPQETTVIPETTVPQETTTIPGTTAKPEETTTVQPTTKPDVDTTGKNVKKGGYVKKNVSAYNLKLEKVTEVEKGVRYYVYKECNNGYSLIKVGNQELLVETKYITYKCNAKKIVNTSDKKYSYSDMKVDLKKLEKAYGSILKVDIAGKSLDKRNLYYITLGNAKAKKTVYVETSVHAREYMNTKFMMKVIEDYCRGYDTKKYKGKKYSTIFNNVKLVIMPMVNPDGVTISQYGPKKIRNAKLRENLYKIAGGVDFKIWKANARGIDINRNYAEGFDRGGAKTPGHKQYAGKTPISEPETKAQVSVVEKVKPDVVICYHQAGEVMYHLNHTKLSNMLYSMTHYTHIISGQTHYGTFSDYLDAGNILNCTLETGLTPAPVKNSMYKKIYKTNKDVLVAVAKMYL